MISSNEIFIYVYPPPSAKFSTDLPILKKAADAYKIWQAALPGIPKLSRYTLGSKIDVLFLETIELILLAGYTSKEQKLPLLKRVSGKLDTLKFFLQLTWEIKALDNKKYLAIAAPVAEMGKMLGGWLKQLQP